MSVFRFFLLLIVFQLSFISLNAQQPLAHSSRAPRKLGVDSSRVQPIQISEETEKKIFSDKDYVYKEDELKRGRNFIQEMIDWFSHKAEDNTPQSQSRRGGNSNTYSRGSSSGSSGSGWNGDGVGSIVIVLFIIVIIAGLVALIATGKWKKIFTPKPMESPFDFKEITEDIEGLNIDKLIEEARLAGDYRLATRWWYLKLLKKFTVCEFINWKPHKTNHDYFRELQHTNYIAPFKQASHVYEHVWYGEMPVSEEMYNQYTPQFAELEKSINA
ncbi:MAG: DUF4129 domain-containing protein [Bacteroidia bacterium]|nr:DUF4129 domain-containing protein [Bacteroidia bacterium]